MKVLFVTHRYPPRTGGVETHVQELATRLVDRGHEVTVFSADAGSDIPSNHTVNGVRVRRFRSLSPGGAFYAAPQMTHAIRQAEADVIHAHNYHAFPLFFVALGVADERFVVTTHYHGQSASGFRDVLLSCYRPFGRWALRQADDVIAVSEWEQRQLWSDFGVDATVIPNGVDVERFANADPEQRDHPYLLCVGRLEEYKGVQHVIRALSELPEYDLVIAGSGPYREELERIALDESVADRVDFLGYVDDKRLPGLYTGAEAYVTMSEFEAYGMTVAEALASGTCCVVRQSGALTDWTSIPAVVDVADASASTIQNAIRTVNCNTDETGLSTWGNVVDRLVEILEVE
ncbi:glycosyltransferase family 4 protein [Halorhabdus salina]|uniref:glycosyltransferase family 4 protein n=1 Tax=Halorhabdus salina TaxID=2750670 RepID=UPI0015EF31DA|nr:glycosyltransferase family 4 protein [Halorhabdus salina]